MLYYRQTLKNTFQEGAARFKLGHFKYIYFLDSDKMPSFLPSNHMVKKIFLVKTKGFCFWKKRKKNANTSVLCEQDKLPSEKFKKVLGFGVGGVN